MAFAWTYSDWRRRALYPTDADKYDRLVLHIEEVANHVMEIEHGDKRKGAVLKDYLDSLNEEADRLLKRIEAGGRTSRSIRLRANFPRC